MLPVVYLAVAAALAAVALPTSLRPPPEQTNAAAELSPDAPPEDDPATIIQSLRQAGSRTAGATGEQGQAPVSTTTTSIVRLPSRGQCYGDPPRQFDSVYAPPCRPAFVGDNGGETSRGVTGTEIRIALSPDLTGTRGCGEIPDEPTPDEGNATRTYRVLKQFFNENMELHGRRMRWFYACAPEGSGGEEAERARGVRIAEYGAFASIGEFSGPVAEEATRRGVIHFANIVVVPDEYYAARFPFLWGSRTNASKAVDFGSAYLCRRLHGNKPFPTGDSLIDYDAPRSFGILALDAPDTHAAVEGMVRGMRERCGAEPDEIATYNLDTDDNAQGIATAMSKLRAANVSTIVFMGEILTLPLQAQAADNQQFFPEWYLMGYGGFETAVILTRTVSPRQWQNAFGFSFEEIPLRPEETACWRAYKSIEPSTNPDANICNIMFHSMTFLFGAMQEAGPDLDPDTFKDALFRSFTRPPEPVWSMSGGFGPGDYTYGDFAVELWWSPTATHPDRQPGAYVYPNCGRRFGIDSIPTGNPDHMFTDLPTNVTHGLVAGPGCEAR